MTSAISLLTDSLSAFMRWWVCELRSLGPLQKIAALMRGPHLIVSPKEKGDHALTLIRWGKDRHICDLSSSGNQKQTISSGLLKIPAILQIPDSVALIKTIDLPLVARKDRRQAVGYQIPHITPFTRDDIYFGLDNVDKRRSGSIEHVDVHIVPKQTIDDTLSLSGASALNIVGIETVCGRVTLQHDSDETRTKAKTGGFETRFQRALCLAVAILMLCWPLLFNRYLSLQLDELSAVNSRLLDEIKQGQKLSKEIANRITQNGYLHKKRFQDPHLSELITHLAKALSDESRLSALTLQGKKITIRGFSGNGATLLQRVETSPEFAEAHFSSPVVRQSSAKLEQFEISMTVSVSGDQK